MNKLKRLLHKCEGRQIVIYQDTPRHESARIWNLGFCEWVRNPNPLHPKSRKQGRFDCGLNLSQPRSTFDGPTTATFRKNVVEGDDVDPKPTPDGTWLVLVPYKLKRTLFMPKGITT